MLPAATCDKNWNFWATRYFRCCSIEGRISYPPHMHLSLVGLFNINNTVETSPLRFFMTNLLFSVHCSLSAAAPIYQSAEFWTTEKYNTRRCGRKRLHTEYKLIWNETRCFRQVPCTWACCFPVNLVLLIRLRCNSLGSLCLAVINDDSSNFVCTSIDGWVDSQFGIANLEMWWCRDNRKRCNDNNNNNYYYYYLGHPVFPLAQ